MRLVPKKTARLFYTLISTKTTMNNDESFIRLPMSLIKDNRFTLTESAIIAYRLGYKNYFANNQSVADLFGVSKKTVCVAFQKAKKYGIVKSEQLVIETRMEQSGSYLTVTGSYITVTDDYPTVTACYPTVTDELHYGNSKEAISPMKTDLLLDNDKILNKIIDKKEDKIADNIITNSYPTVTPSIMNQFDELFSEYKK